MAGTLTRPTVLAGLALLTFGADDAVAQGPPAPALPSEAAVHQYREAIPTSAGPVAPEARAERTTPLPPPAARQVRELGGPDAPVLERVAISSTYGAPQQAGRGRLDPDAAPPVAPEGRRDPDPSVTRGLEATAEAVAEGRVRIWALLLAMLLVGAVVAVAARRQAPG
jgi:hypothetical protein